MNLLQDFFNASLIVKDYNISTWSNTTNTGLWLGLGYGSSQLEGTDFTVCEYNYTNSTSDSFVCMDGMYENGGFNFSENQNITSNQTVQADFNYETGTANFTVNFVRPFLTEEVGKDTNLTATQMSFYWAYGPIENGIIAASEATNKGAVVLDLSPSEQAETPPASSETPSGTEGETQPETPAEKERPKPLRGSSVASSLNVVFSGLFFAGVVLHLS